MTDAAGEEQRDLASLIKAWRGRTTAGLARTASALVFVVAGVLVLAAVWGIVRAQQHAAPFSIYSSDLGDTVALGPTLVERIDILTGGLRSLGEAMLVLGAGVGLRALADALDRPRSA